MKNTTYIKLMALVLAFGVTYGHAGQQKRGLQRVKDAFRASDYTKEQWQSGNRLKAIGSYLGGYKDAKKTYQQGKAGSVASSASAFTDSDSVDEFLPTPSEQPFSAVAGTSNVRQMERQASLRRLPSQASVRTMVGGGGQESAVQQAFYKLSPEVQAAINREAVADNQFNSAKLTFDKKARKGKLNLQHFQDAISSAEARLSAKLGAYQGMSQQTKLSEQAKNDFLEKKADFQKRFFEKAKLPKIQALVRGHLARKKLDDEAKQKKAATQIQSIWRGSRVRKANAPEQLAKMAEKAKDLVLALSSRSNLGEKGLQQIEAMLNHAKKHKLPLPVSALSAAGSTIDQDNPISFLERKIVEARAKNAEQAAFAQTPAGVKQAAEARAAAVAEEDERRTAEAERRE